MENLQKKVDTTKADARKRFDTTKADVRKRFDKINLETKKIYTGVGNDAKLIVEDFIDFGKKNLNKLPIKKSVESKFSAGINSIHSKLNLHSKEEIDNLVNGLDSVNKKVDAMSKKFATS